jgi:hypothetical protein
MVLAARAHRATFIKLPLLVTGCRGGGGLTPQEADNLRMIATGAHSLRLMHNPLKLRPALLCDDADMCHMLHAVVTPCASYMCWT